MTGYTFTVESEIRAPGILVEVAQYNWSEPQEGGEHLRRHALGLILSPQLTYAKTCYSTDETSSSFVDTGTLLFMPADVFLETRSAAGSLRNVICYFDRGWFEDLTGLGHDWHSDQLSACLNIKNHQLTQTLLRLAKEAEAPGFASAKLTEGLGMLTAIELARHLRGIRAKPKSAVQTLTPWQMRRITEYFEALSGHVPDIADIAEQCGISSRHFRRLFKQTTDQTIYEYSNGVWVSKAKLLLSESDLSLKEISAQLAFSDARSFSIAFRRAVGSAPRAFRQRFRRPAAI